MPTQEFTPDQFPVLLDWPIQWGDQDLFGHVNNVVYFRWFESARVNFMERLGLARLHGQDVSYGPILAHTGCNFRRQLQFPDTVRIGSRVARIGNTSFTLEHALWSTAQEMALAAEGTSIVVTFDYRAQKPIPVPDELRRAIEQLEGKKFE
jgi:acyl-CoA thioester hydrolase